MATNPDVPTWVGRLDRLAVTRDLAVGPNYGAARLLVTVGGTPQGQITVPLVGGRATAADLDRAAARLGPIDDVAPSSVATEPVTVVVATRNRSESLARCVRAVLASDHPELSVVVVDNDPDDERTEQAVAALGSSRVRYVRENRRGASIGRNRGLAEARTGIVAFTDDDTEVDPGWASRIAGAFAADPELACVSGPVLAARLGTPEERAADVALAWNKGFAPRRFSLARPPEDSPIFPFAPGLLGIGANLAVRATAARRIGGFDEALGPGTPTHGGEDAEFLVRMVLAGYVTGYVPGAFLWHHHRPDQDALATQLEGYALGLGAFLTKVAVSRQGRSAALRRLPAAVSRLRHISRREAEGGEAMPDAGALQRGARLARGGWAYLNRSSLVRRTGGAVPPLLLPPRVTTVPANIRRAAAIAVNPAPEPAVHEAARASLRSVPSGADESAREVVPGPRSGHGAASSASPRLHLVG